MSGDSLGLNCHHTSYLFTAARLNLDSIEEGGQKAAALRPVTMGSNKVAGGKYMHNIATNCDTSVCHSIYCGDLDHFRDSLVAPCAIWEKGGRTYYMLISTPGWLVWAGGLGYLGWVAGLGARLVIALKNRLRYIYLI